MNLLFNLQLYGDIIIIFLVLTNNVMVTEKKVYAVISRHSLFV